MSGMVTFSHWTCGSTDITWANVNVKDEHGTLTDLNCVDMVTSCSTRHHQDWELTLEVDVPGASFLAFCHSTASINIRPWGWGQLLVDHDEHTWRCNPSCITDGLAYRAWFEVMVIAWSYTMIKLGKTTSFDKTVVLHQTLLDLGDNLLQSAYSLLQTAAIHSPVMQQASKIVYKSSLHWKDFVP